MDAGEGAGLEVQHADLAGVHHGPDTEYLISCSR